MTFQISLEPSQEQTVLLETFEEQMEHLAKAAIHNLCSSPSHVSPLPDTIYSGIDKIRCSLEYRDLILEFVRNHDIPLSVFPIPTSVVCSLDTFGLHFLSDIITLSTDELCCHYAVSKLSANRIARLLDACVQNNAESINAVAHRQVFSVRTCPSREILKPICAAYRLMKSDNLSVIRQFLNAPLDFFDFSSYEPLLRECGDRNLAAFATRTPAAFLSISQFGAARLEFCLKKQRELYCLILPWISSKLHGISICCSDTFIERDVQQILTPKADALTPVLGINEIVGRLPECISGKQLEGVLNHMRAAGQVQQSERGWNLCLVPLTAKDLSVCTEEERIQLTDSFVHPSRRLPGHSISMHICRRAFAKAYTRHLKSFGLPPREDLLLVDFQKDRTRLSGFAKLRFHDLMYLLYRKAVLPGFERGLCGGLPDPADVITAFAFHSPDRRISPEMYADLVRIFDLLQPGRLPGAEGNTERIEAALAILDHHPCLLKTAQGVVYRDPQQDQNLLDRLFLPLPPRKYLSLSGFFSEHRQDIEGAGFSDPEDFLHLVQKREKDFVLSPDHRFFALGTISRKEAVMLILENEGPQSNNELERKLTGFPLDQETSEFDSAHIMEIEGILYLKDSYACQLQLFKKLFHNPFYFHTDMVDIWKTVDSGRMLPSQSIIEEGGYSAEPEWMLRRGWSMEEAVAQYLLELGSFLAQDILKKAKRRQLPFRKIIDQLEHDGKLYRLSEGRYCSRAFLLSAAVSAKERREAFFNSIDQVLPDIGELFTLSSLCDRGLRPGELSKDTAQALLTVHLRDIGGFLFLRIGETLAFYHDRRTNMRGKAESMAVHPDVRYEKACWQSAVFHLGQNQDQSQNPKTALLLQKFREAGCTCTEEALAGILMKQNIFFSMDGQIYMNRKSALRANNRFSQQSGRECG